MAIYTPIPYHRQFLRWLYGTGMGIPVNCVTPMCIWYGAHCYLSQAIHNEIFTVPPLCSLLPSLHSLWPFRKTPMTLSSRSHQHRKSMLPAPCPSSRIGSTRPAMDNTSRIARRVPHPPLAPRTSFHNAPITQAHVPPPSGNCSLHIPESSSRRAHSLSRIPSPSGQALYPTLESSSLSPPIRTLRLEGKRVKAHYLTPPASVETKNERFKDQGDTNLVQHHSTDIGAPALPVRHPSRHLASTTLVAFSRTENSSPVDGGLTLVLARKKSTLATSSNGKENCRSKAQARIHESPPLAAGPVAIIPLRSIRRTAIVQRSRASSRETLQRPLVIRKRSSKSLPASSAPENLRARSAASASVLVPNGIKAIMGDLDRFAKEWTVMFSNLFTSAGTTSREDGLSNSNLSSRIHSTIKLGRVEASLAENPAIGKVTANYPVPRPSGSVSSVNALKASSLVSSDGEMVNFDVTAVSLSRWQHNGNVMLKDVPLQARTVRVLIVFSGGCQRSFPFQKSDLSEMACALAQDSPNTDKTHLHPPKAIPRSQPVPITPQASRNIPPLPEVSVL